MPRYKNMIETFHGGLCEMAASDSHPYTPVYPGPNADLLEAQARVCTGPHQTRPLGVNASDFPQPEPLLETLLKSIAGELPESDAASAAQMGAFFAAMTLRAYFPNATQWSLAEEAAFRKHRPALTKQLPPEIQYLMNPERSYVPANPCLLYTSPSPRDRTRSRMPSSA